MLLQKYLKLLVQGGASKYYRENTFILSGWKMVNKTMPQGGCPFSAVWNYIRKLSRDKWKMYFPPLPKRYYCQTLIQNECFMHISHYLDRVYFHPRISYMLSSYIEHSTLIQGSWIQNSSEIHSSTLPLVLEFLNVYETNISCNNNNIKHITQKKMFVPKCRRRPQWHYEEHF